MLLRRYFPSEIVRWRARAGSMGFNEYGEYVEPSRVRSLLAASVQPQEDVGDSETVGGMIFSNRVTVYVPIAAHRFIGSGDVLRWGGVALAWGGEALTWGNLSGLVAGSDRPLYAAEEGGAGDVVEIGGAKFDVIESRVWPGSHCQAELLRQN